MTRPLITTATLAARLGIKQRAAQYLVKLHGIGQRIGRDVLLSEADVRHLEAIRRPRGRPPGSKNKHD